MSFIEVKKYLTETKIKCFKYNNSLDKEVQNKPYYEAMFSLS